MFPDRREAGRRLARRLGHLRSADPLVLALPRGGVPVGLEIATALEAPLDLVLVRKLGVPWQPELALGAVVDGAAPHTVLNDSVVRATRITPAEIEAIARSERAEIERRRRLWLSDRARAPVKGRSAILVDDGVATGASVRAALEALRLQAPKRIVVAMPVAPRDTARELERECDEAVFLLTPEDFFALGQFYEDFHQLTDDEVRALLQLAPA